MNLPKLKDKKHSIPVESRNKGNDDLVVLGSSAEQTKATNKKIEPKLMLSRKVKVFGVHL